MQNRTQIKTSFLIAVALVVCSPLSMAGKQIKSGEQKLSVVELYTSEGCSSCPPADKFLSRLGKTVEADQIVPLAFHVDYWDYIGWKDPYADAKFTSRQRKIAKINNQRSIYTPEFVVDGQEARGSRSITKQVQSVNKTPSQADITLNYSDDEGQLIAKVLIEAIRYQGDDKPQVYLAVYENDLSSSIDAGENDGRTLKHDYVVRYLSKAEKTKEGMAHEFSLPIDPSWNKEALGVTVVVKLKKSGKTLQALKGVL